MKKVLIFYGTYGGGHLSAAKALRAHIEENYEDTQVEMVDCIEYVNRYLNKLTTKAYSEMAKKAPWAWKRVYYGSEKGLLSNVSNVTNKLMSSKLNRLVQKIKPDLIISTHPFSSQMCGRLKRRGKVSCKIATVMTDFHMHPQWLAESDYVSYYFVSNSQMKKDLIQNNIDQFKIFVTGIPLSKKFSEDFNTNEILKEFELVPGKFTVLFFAGGEFGLGKTRTFEIFKSLVQNFPNFQIVAISGKNEKMNTLFCEFVQENNAIKRVKVLKYTNKVPELMYISDVVLTKPGGLTSSESLASGLPIIIINPIPGQEEQNAEFLVKNKAAVWLKKEDNEKEFLINILNNSENLNNLKQHSILLAKPNSCADICRILLDV